MKIILRLLSSDYGIRTAFITQKYKFRPRTLLSKLFPIM